jgi:hypothetical protein
MRKKGFNYSDLSQGQIGDRVVVADAESQGSCTQRRYARNTLHANLYPDLHPDAAMPNDELLEVSCPHR